MSEKPIVGYRNPPVEHQFQPGHSGNPGGRPKSLKSTQQIVERLLAEQWLGGTGHMTVQEALVQTLVTAALTNPALVPKVLALARTPSDAEHAAPVLPEDLVRELENDPAKGEK